MNLFLLLLILIIIYVGIYLYKNYMNYSIQDIGNIEIVQKIHEKKHTKINNNNSNKLIDNYLNKNTIQDINSESNLNSELNLDLNPNPNPNLNYVDTLMINSNLNIKIPTHDNPECINSNNLTKQNNIKPNPIIDWYLMANSDCDVS